jgi:predicted RNA-binding Zn ribbon-like protein
VTGSTKAAGMDPVVLAVAGWLALAVEGERRLREHLDRLIGARRALQRPGVAALEAFLRDEAPAALDAIDALLGTDDTLVLRAMAQRPLITRPLPSDGEAP